MAAAGTFYPLVQPVWVEERMKKRKREREREREREMPGAIKSENDVKRKENGIIFFRSSFFLSAYRHSLPLRM